MLQGDTSYNQRPTASEIYEFARQKGSLLHVSFLTIKSLQSFIPQLTYRKINSWDAKGLISSDRMTKDSGWRLFSLLGVIKIRIISDLKQFGFHSDTIKIILKNMLKTSIFGSDKNISQDNIKAGLEYNVFASMLGQKTLLLIDNEGNPFFLPENEAVKKHFLDNQTFSPILTLPFYSYVKTIVDKTQYNTKINKETTAQSLINELTVQEKKVIELIRDKDWEEITIKKPNGKELTLKGKTWQQGTFSDMDVINAINSRKYQTVKVITVDGKKIGITREETIKV